MILYKCQLFITLLKVRDLKWDLLHKIMKVLDSWRYFIPKVLDLFFHDVLKIMTVVLNPIQFQFITHAMVMESICLSIHNIMNFVYNCVSICFCNDIITGYDFVATYLLWNASSRKQDFTHFYGHTYIY